MITEREYKEAQMIIKMYESQNNKKVIPPPPLPPPDRFLKEGSEPPKPKNYHN
jgi:hypothetical protein